MGITMFPKTGVRTPAFKWVNNIHWFSALITGLLLLTFINTLRDSYWVRTPPPLYLVGLLATLNGLLLGKTRWSIGWGLAYSFLLAVGFGIQIVGKIISGFNQFWYDWLESINWQLFLFLERVKSWWVSTQQQRIIYDEGFWSIVLIIISWVSTTWLVICLIRGKNLWLAFVPLLGSIAFILQSDRKNVGMLLLSLLIAMVLIATQNYSKSEKKWLQQKVDYPDQLWINWSLAIAIITPTVLFLAFLAPIVATPEGWRDIQNWFEEIRSPRTTPVASENQQRSEFRVTQRSEAELQLLQPLDLSYIGNPLPQMEGTVMWIRVGDTIPRPWRMAIFSTYTGSGWLEADLDEDRTIAVEGTPQIGRKALYQRFTLFRAGRGRLFAAAEPVQSLNQDVQLIALANGNSNIVSGYVQRYELISWVPNVTAEMLNAVSGEIPEEILEIYLQVPDTLPLRVNNLANRLMQAQSTVYQKVITTQEYVRQSVPYDLNAPLPDTGQDLVDYFLFEAPSGFCSYYATSMAVLLRLEGIPARVVSGYAPGIFVAEEGNFEVGGDQVHAWVEVYFPDYGWIPFEPTPSQAVPAYSYLSGEVSQPEPDLSIEAQTKDGWNWLLILFSMAIGLCVIVMGRFLVRFVRFRRIEKKLALHPAAKLYRRLRIMLANTGISADPHITPREFLIRTQERLKEYPKLKQALEINTNTFEKSEFSSRFIKKEEIDLLKTTMQGAKKEQIYLLIDSHLQKLKSKLKL